MKKQSIFILTIIAIAVFVGVWRESHHTVAKNTKIDNAIVIPNETKLLAATVLPQPKAVPEFHFINQDNQPFDNNHLQSKWSFAFFGYTKCPQLCPQTLGSMVNLAQRVGPNPHVQYLFISITPEIDTAEQLKSFLAQDNFRLAPFIGLTGNRQDIHTLAAELGIYVAEETNLEIEHFEHSGAILLFNPEGALHGIFTSGEKPHQIAHDFRTIMSHYARS